MIVPIGGSRDSREGRGAHLSLELCQGKCFSIDVGHSVVVDAHVLGLRGVGTSAPLEEGEALERMKNGQHGGGEWSVLWEVGDEHAPAREKRDMAQREREERMAHPVVPAVSWATSHSNAQNASQSLLWIFPQQVLGSSCNLLSNMRVVVVGAGVVGLMTALHLARTGLRVLVVYVSHFSLPPST